MELNDHIALFPKALIKGECDYIIDQYEKFSKMNLTYPRIEHPYDKNDTTVYPLDPNIREMTEYDDFLHHFLEVLWTNFDQYARRFPSVRGQDQTLYIRGMRIQKTLPGEGFHAWHCENGRLSTMRRVVAFSCFLNDVDDGGETEFLEQHKRYKASAGDLLIFPAGFTHTHRGNTPISNEKYIITGWIEL